MTRAQHSANARLGLLSELESPDAGLLSRNDGLVHMFCELAKNSKEHAQNTEPRLFQARALQNATNVQKQRIDAIPITVRVWVQCTHVLICVHAIG